MPVTLLSQEIHFPSPEITHHSGLLAVGGDLSKERLLLAYRSGIFPWFSEEEPIQWWCPDPRFVLHPSNLYVSKSMNQLLKKNRFTWTVNKAFPRVMRACADLRKEEGTWITEDMFVAYVNLHEAGYAISVETWEGEELVGGLYGIRMGRLFFGESMFSKVSNASKFAFIHFVKQLQDEGVVLVDCQVYTDHLASLGAGFISRDQFLCLLKENVDC